MTKLQNLFVTLVNMDIFQMTLKLSLFTTDYISVISVETLRLHFCVCRHEECLQMYHQGQILNVDCAPQ